MADQASERLKASCPHCGQRVKLGILALLPSGDKRRVLKCSSCGGRFDLSDNCKIASMLAGLAALGPGIFLFAKIIHAGHGKTPYIVLATALLALAFALTAAAVARLTLRLEPKP